MKSPKASPESLPRPQAPACPTPLLPEQLRVPRCPQFPGSQVPRVPRCCHTARRRTDRSTQPRKTCLSYVVAPIEAKNNQVSLTYTNIVKTICPWSPNTQQSVYSLVFVVKHSATCSSLIQPSAPIKRESLHLSWPPKKTRDSNRCLFYTEFCKTTVI